MPSCIQIIPFSFPFLSVTSLDHLLKTQIIFVSFLSMQQGQVQLHSGFLSTSLPLSPHAPPLRSQVTSLQKSPTFTIIPFSIPMIPGCELHFSKGPSRSVTQLQQVNFQRGNYYVSSSSQNLFTPYQRECTTRMFFKLQKNIEKKVQKRHIFK